MIQSVRGTRDLAPEEMRTHRRVIDSARAVAARYGHDEIATPIFELTEVFLRTLGETSDVVSKEMYTFIDRNGDSLTLRPENTAGVARAFVSNGWVQQTPRRVFYAGPMFRRERPQKGRQRQFHQIGIETLGAAEPWADVEAIACAAAVLRALGLDDRVTLELNTLGNAASRAAWRAALVAYFGAQRAALSAESQARLDRNPLRILDSKAPEDRAIAQSAPPFADFLDADSAGFFRQVRAGLEALGIAYVQVPHLVRGLDYYQHTAFEFTTTALGAQGTVLAGGRYDGLIRSLGGPETPGVGWAAGVERLALLASPPPPPPPPVAFVPLGPAATARLAPLAEAARAAGIRVEVVHDGGLKRRLKQADRLGARLAVIVGDEEVLRGVATVRDMQGGAQSEALLDRLVDALRP